MNSEKPARMLKWCHLNNLGLTRNYCAGIIAGFGLGVVVTVLVGDLNVVHPGWTWIIIPAFMLISIGSYMATKKKGVKRGDTNNRQGE
jgi:hypothetical protein